MTNLKKVSLALGLVLVITAALLTTSKFLSSHEAKRSNKPSDLSTVTVNFTLSPSSPVCVAGLPCTAPWVNNLVSFYDQKTGEKVFEGRTDSQGNLNVNLKPGDYFVNPQTGQPKGYRKAQNFTVVAGQNLDLKIVVDSGIR